MPAALLNRPQDPSVLVIALGLTRESRTITPAPAGGKNRRGREQGGWRDLVEIAPMSCAVLLSVSIAVMRSVIFVAPSAVRFDRCGGVAEPGAASPQSFASAARVQNLYASACG